MAKKPIRVVVDTNIWISYLINPKGNSQFDAAIKSKKVTLIFSKELFDEFLEVTQRPKFKVYFTQKNIDLLIRALKLHAEFVEVRSKLNICRDEKDNFVLALCQKGKVDFLITGDNDLTILKSYRKTAIITLRNFLDYIK